MKHEGAKAGAGIKMLLFSVARFDFAIAHNVPGAKKRERVR